MCVCVCRLGGGGGGGGVGQKLTSVFVMFPEHCSVTQSASGEGMLCVCDVPPGPYCGYVLAAAVESCGWSCDPKKTPVDWSSERSPGAHVEACRGVDGRIAVQNNVC